MELLSVHQNYTDFLKTQQDNGRIIYSNFTNEKYLTAFEIDEELNSKVKSNGVPSIKDCFLHNSGIEEEEALSHMLAASVACCSCLLGTGLACSTLFTLLCLAV